MGNKNKGVGYSIDDAIKHEMAVVEKATAIKLRTEYSLEGYSKTKVSQVYDENIAYHKQIAEWLKELKRYKKNDTSKS